MVGTFSRVPDVNENFRVAYANFRNVFFELEKKLINLVFLKGTEHKVIENSPYLRVFNVFKNDLHFLIGVNGEELSNIPRFSTEGEENLSVTLGNA